MDNWPGFVCYVVASLIFLWSVVKNHIPPTLGSRVSTLADKLASYVWPYVHITISEYGTERFQRSEFFIAAEAYLSVACVRRARKLTAELGRDSKNIQVSVDDQEEVTDTFDGATVWWYASKKQARSTVISFYPNEDERRPVLQSRLPPSPPRPRRRLLPFPRPGAGPRHHRPEPPAPPVHQQPQRQLELQPREERLEPCPVRAPGDIRHPCHGPLREGGHHGRPHSVPARQGLLHQGR
jgi:hypothetical protein